MMSNFRWSKGESKQLFRNNYLLLLAHFFFVFSYKHAIDGLFRVYSEEGFRKLFSGGATATTRAVFVTIGQLSFYDQVKKLLLESGYFQDNLMLHFTASSTAGAIATCMTQPLDVLKTRAMNAKPGEFNGLWDIVKFTAKLGPMGNNLKINDSLTNFHINFFQVSLRDTFQLSFGWVLILF